MQLCIGVTGDTVASSVVLVPRSQQRRPRDYEGRSPNRRVEVSPNKPGSPSLEPKAIQSKPSVNKPEDKKQEDPSAILAPKLAPHTQHCKFFQAGSCETDKNCRFLHVTQDGDIVQTKGSTKAAQFGVILPPTLGESVTDRITTDDETEKPEEPVLEQLVDKKPEPQVTPEKTEKEKEAEPPKIQTFTFPLDVQIPTIKGTQTFIELSGHLYLKLTPEPNAETPEPDPEWLASIKDNIHAIKHPKKNAKTTQVFYDADALSQELHLNANQPKSRKKQKKSRTPPLKPHHLRNFNK